MAMDAHEQIIQRFCDGECSPAESEAVQRLIAQDTAARNIYEDITRLDSALFEQSEQQWARATDQHTLVEQIISVIPDWTPRRHVRINTGFLLLISVLLGMASTIVGYQYNSDTSSLTSLIIMTSVCLAGATVALLLSSTGASPTLLRFRRLLGSAIDLTRLQMLSLRCAAVMLVIVAIWLWGAV